MYFRALVPERSRVEAVSGGSYVPSQRPGGRGGRGRPDRDRHVPQGAPRARPSLTYTWTSPYAADVDQTGGTYQLTIQKQPGLLPGPLSLTIRAPAGFRITDASPGLTVRGDTATLDDHLRPDIVVAGSLHADHSGARRERGGPRLRFRAPLRTSS